MAQQQMYLLLLQRAQVWFLASIWWLITFYNSIPLLASEGNRHTMVLMQAPFVHIHSCRHSFVHINKKNLKNNILHFYSHLILTKRTTIHIGEKVVSITNGADKTG